jgi:hypothetical protein
VRLQGVPSLVHLADEKQRDGRVGHGHVGSIPTPTVPSATLLLRNEKGGPPKSAGSGAALAVLLQAKNPLSYALPVV